MSQQDQSVLSGAAIGTAAGVALGAITGDWVWAAGAIGGYVVDQQRQREQRAFERGVKQGQAQQKQ